MQRVKARPLPREGVTLLAAVGRLLRTPPDQERRCLTRFAVDLRSGALARGLQPLILVVTDLTKGRGTEVVDRRRYPRVALEVPVLVDSLRSWEAAETSDISPGGVAIRSGRDWGTGALVDLYFELPGGFAVDARAQFLGGAEGLGHFRFVDLGASVRCAIKLHMQTTHHSGARAVVHVG